MKKSAIHIMLTILGTSAVAYAGFNEIIQQGASKQLDVETSQVEIQKQKIIKEKQKLALNQADKRKAFAAKIFLDPNNFEAPDDNGNYKSFVN